jgi:Tol biopolymer transport system component
VAASDGLIGDLAGAILDGAPIDWASAESSADGAERPLLEELRLLATVANLHRRLPLSWPADVPERYRSVASADDRVDVLEQWGHLRLLERIGRGGFGDVFRAWDTRLDREVALKLLPASSSNGDPRGTSIIEEGRLLARVRHPNVVTIYGAERIENRIGLWMEFVKGRTLQQAVEQGTTFSATQVIEIGLGLCHAIGAVHDAGLVHRDIKPPNVMLAEDGHVVLMDFGTGHELDEGSRPALAGTPLYLAPELLNGHAPTVRSDIYSFGVLLFHLLTGSYPVHAQSLRDLRVAHGDRATRDVRSLRPDVSAKLARIIQRAIDPQPERRYESAAAITAHLASLKPRPRLLPLANALAVAAALAALVWIGAELRERWAASPSAPGAALAAEAATSPTTASSFAALGVTPATSLPGEESNPAFSPDGNQIAFSSYTRETTATDRDDIYVKQLDSEAIRRVTRGPGADSNPAWSPDGRHIAFLRNAVDEQGRLKRSVMVVPTLGGAERTLWVGSARAAGLDWSPDGEHLLFAGASADNTRIGPPFRLLLLSIESRHIRELTSPPPGTLGDRHGVFSPDGRTIAFVREVESGTDVYVLSLAGGEPARLTFGDQFATSVAWLSGGQALLFSASRRDGSSALWRVAVSGGLSERLTGIADEAGDVATDRRGHRVAFTRTVHDANIQRIDLSTPSRDERVLIASARTDTDPDYSPDATRVAFASNRGGSRQIWIAAADGTNALQLTSLPGRCSDPVWSPDGRRIALASIPPGQVRDDVYVIDVDGGPALRLTDDPAVDVWPRWSRDGQWIYFTSYRSGSWQLWKVPALGGPALQVTRDGGLRAAESIDGRFLYFSKDPPAIWSRPTSGGDATRILELPSRTDWGGEWIVADSGIYFENVEAVPRPAVDFFSFATRQTQRVAVFAGDRETGDGFVISPDRRWLLYAKREYFNVDIMVAELVR